MDTGGGAGEAGRVWRSRSMTNATCKPEKRNRSQEQETLQSLRKWAAQLDLQKAQMAMQDGRESRTHGQQRPSSGHRIRTQTPTNQSSSTEIRTIRVQPAATQTPGPPRKVTNTATSPVRAYPAPVRCGQNKPIKPVWALDSRGRLRPTTIYVQPARPVNCPIPPVRKEHVERSGNLSPQRSLYTTEHNGAPAVATSGGADAEPAPVPDSKSPPPTLRIRASSESHALVHTASDSDFAGEQPDVLRLYSAKGDTPSPSMEMSSAESLLTESAATGNIVELHWCSPQQSGNNKNKKRVQFADSLGHELACVKHFNEEEGLAFASPGQKGCSHLLLHNLMMKEQERAESKLCEQVLSELHLEDIQRQEQRPRRSPTPPSPQPSTPPGQRPSTPPGQRPSTPPGQRPSTPPSQRPSTPPNQRPSATPSQRPSAPSNQLPPAPPSERTATPPCQRSLTPPCQRSLTPPRALKTEQKVIEMLPRPEQGDGRPPAPPRSHQRERRAAAEVLDSRYMAGSNSSSPQEDEGISYRMRLDALF